jgi:hypothetical protein
LRIHCRTTTACGGRALRAGALKETTPIACWQQLVGSCRCATVLPDVQPATAIWIAAATLDRYLQNIGQKQIFGTQFLTHSQNDPEGWTQEPYDRTLISDALWDQLGVPAQKVQEEQ